MTCCHSEAAERQFTEALARRDVSRYRRKGPDKTTRAILDGVDRLHLEGLSLLDVGGGIGIIVHELLAKGVERATLVEAAPAYLHAAQSEARERGHADRIRFVSGDFVSVAASVATAEVVTLDRVVCCYPDYERLLGSAAAKTQQVLAFSYPRDRWYVRAVVAVENAFRRLTGNAFRTFVHRARRMHDLLEAAGLELCHERVMTAWQVAVYRRRAANAVDDRAA